MGEGPWHWPAALPRRICLYPCPGNVGMGPGFRPAPDPDKAWTGLIWLGGWAYLVMAAAAIFF